MNILTFPKYCFFDFSVELGGDKDPATAVLHTETVFSSSFVPLSSTVVLQLSTNESSSVTILVTTTSGLRTLTSLTLTLGLVDTGLLAWLASSQTKYLHPDFLPFGHAKNERPALGPGDPTVHCLALRPHLQSGLVRRIVRLAKDEGGRFRGVLKTDSVVCEAAVSDNFSRASRCLNDMEIGVSYGI